MKVEIISEITIANPKEKELCGVVQETRIFAKVNDDLTVFPIRYKIKNGMVTVL